MKHLFVILPLLLALSSKGYGQLASGDRPVVRARYLVSQGLFQEASSLADSVLTTGNSSGEWVKIRAEALVGEGRAAEAASILLPIASQTNPELLYSLARYYAIAGDESAACKYLREHLSSPEHLPERYIKTDNAFRGIEEGLEWIRVWQQEWYTGEERTLEEVRYLIIRNQTEEAAEKLDALLAGISGSPESSFLKGQILWFQGKERVAREQLGQAVMGARNDRHLLEDMMSFFGIKELKDLELQTVNQLIALDPTNPDYLIRRALLRSDTGGEASADRELRALDDLGINSAELDYQAGIRFAGRDPGKAENLLTRAIDSGVLDARYYYTRGILRCDQSKVDEGLADLAMSLDINPKQPDLYLKRGEIRHGEGDLEGACYDWRKALEMGSSRAADLLAKYCR